MADDTNDSTFTVGGRRGRPRGTTRATEPKSVLSAYVPAEYHDRLSQLSRQHGVSVSSLVTRVLGQALKKR